MNSVYWSPGGSVTLNFVKDFFISYNNADHAWAEWIAWQLEEAGFSTLLQAWDFRPGSNFVLDMHKALQASGRTIAVLSPDYLANASYAASEWAAIVSQDPTGQTRKLLPVRVRECEPFGLLSAITYIDLVGLDGIDASHRLLAGIDLKRAKPAVSPHYPGKTASSPSQEPTYPANWPDINNIPYPRNAFFTGRDDLLQHLHDKLTTTNATALTQAQAISGLGGIGKTQAAIEYIYRYEHAYRYVLWTSAATSEAILNDFAGIATLLKLPGYDPQDQRTLIPTLHQWLTQQRGWLLILDNADDLPMMRSFIPPKPNPGGHILLTTRTRATGAIAQPVEVDKLDEHEGTLLLLRRAGMIGPNEQVDKVTEKTATVAHAIVTAMAGLPLALDQAGGYIEETGCTLIDYLQLYQQHRQELLNWRSLLSPDYPATVATTWSLAFQRIEQANPVTAALLQFCAFLAPDAIPENIIRQITDDPGDVLKEFASDAFKLNAALEILRRYSLMRRNTGTKTLTLHRLVQVVLQDTMPQEIQIMWAKCVINTLNKCFLLAPEQQFALEQYVPHAYVCLELIDRYSLMLPFAAELLLKVGDYLQVYARYKEAEIFYQKVVAIYEKLYGNVHVAMALPLYKIGQLYHTQDCFKDAELYYQRTLAIYIKLQEENKEIADTWHMLGRLYHRQGQYKQAEEAYQKSFHIFDKLILSGDFAKNEFPDIVILFYELATLYEEQGNYKLAEDFFEAAKPISNSESLLMADSINMPMLLNILAAHYRNEDQYDKVEALYQRTLEAIEKQFGTEHPTTAIILHEFALYRRGQGRYEEASISYLQALSIREKFFGKNHASIATLLHELALIRREQGNDKEAEVLFLRALNIREKTLGVDHISTGAAFHELARLYEDQCRYEESVLFYQQALNVYEKVLGKHPDNAMVLSELSRVYEAQNNFEASIQIALQALSIYENNQGTESQYTTSVLAYLAKLYQAQNDYKQAELYYQRALSMSERELGVDHSDTGKTLRGYATLLRILQREDEALELEARIKQ